MYSVKFFFGMNFNQKKFTSVYCKQLPKMHDFNHSKKKKVPVYSVTPYLLRKKKLIINTHTKLE